MTDVALTVRLDDRTVRELSRLGAGEGLSPEEVLARMAEDRVRTQLFFTERAARADGAAFDKVFGRDRSSGAPPREGDEIDAAP